MHVTEFLRDLKLVLYSMKSILKSRLWCKEEISMHSQLKETGIISMKKYQP